MRIIRSLVVLLLLVPALVCADELEDLLNSEIDSDQTSQILSRMSLDQKIGQLFLLGFIGTDFDNHLKPLLEKYQPGGIILFGRNIKTASQVLNLNVRAQKFMLQRTEVPILISVDQEGGTVSRIKSTPPQPSALAIGNTASPELSKKIGYYTGKVLRSLGFNLNLAPVVDIAHPNSPSFLGTRTFAGDPEIVGQFSHAFASGLHSSGVMSTLKHFPGHGNERFDPHIRIPEIPDNLQTLENTRLKPFKYLVEEFRPAAIMVAHLGVPNIDPAAKAATYSSVLIKDLLRKKWGYQGIVMTDDIDMAAAQDLIPSASTQAIKALKAGVDMVMIAWNKKSQREAAGAVKQAIKNGTLTIQEIDEKVARIISTKLNFRLFESELPNIRQVKMALRDPNLKKAFDEVTQFNLNASFQRRPASLAKPNNKVVVISRSRNFMTSFVEKVSPKCCSTRSILDIEDINRTLESDKDSLAVIHVSGRATADIVNKIAQNFRKRVIVVNTNSPSLVMAPETYARTINLFTYHPELGGLLAEKIVSPFSTNKQIHME